MKEVPPAPNNGGVGFRRSLFFPAPPLLGAGGTLKKGFTLIELLVVMTIIGLLAALLFPVFAKVRENGRRTACLSNEKQLGLAISQYAADNDAYFPNTQSPDNADDWTLQVFPYIKSASVYRCPDDPTEDGDINLPGWTTHYYVDSYAINADLQGPPAPKFDPTAAFVLKMLPSYSEGVLAAPAKTVLLFEVADDTTALTPPGDEAVACAASGSAGDPSTPSPPFAEGCRASAAGISAGVNYATGLIGGRGLVLSNGTSGQVIGGLQSTDPRHGAGANYLACDGHGVWLRPEAVSGGGSQPAGGAACGQDDTAAGCAGTGKAAGTGSSRYALTFSVK